MIARRFLWLAALAALAAGCKSPDSITRPAGDATVDPGPRPDVPALDVGDLPVAGEDVVAPDPGGDVVAPDAIEDTAPDTADVPWVPVVRTCATTLKFTPPSGAPTSVGVCGPWNNWGEQGTPEAPRACDPMTAAGDGSWTITYGAGKPTSAGEYPYKYVVDGGSGGWYVDPANPLVMYDGAQKVENSKLIVPDCDLPLIELVSASADWAAKKVSVEARLFNGIAGGDLAHDKVRVELNGEPLAADGFDPATQTWRITLADPKPGKYAFLFRAANAHGDAEPLFVPVWLEEKPFAWSDAILYFAMTDRFANGDPANDAPASCLDAGNKANWLGGDFAGLKKKIEDGYFDGIGVNAIWISAANDNPEGCDPGDLDKLYTSYHAYHPISLDQVENHFGTMEELRAMTRAAHDRGIRVLMDLAANHVYQDCPLWSTRKDWFHQQMLLCGDADNWNDHPVDCWFRPFLPDLDYTNNDAVNAFTDAAIDWILNAGFDGFRVDAVKHLDPLHGTHAFVRTLKWKLQRRAETTGIPIYLVGETFVGTWGDFNQKANFKNEEIVKAYVSDLELQGQFNFPLYWVIVSTLARHEGDMGKLADVLTGSLGFYGAGALMSNFLGNHDIARFASHANGDIADMWSNGAKEVGWDNPPAQPASPAPYARIRMAFAFLMTIPGIPLIYYGDEVAMAGAGDPDNRRMMTFDGLTADQLATKEAVGKLAKARLAHPATRTGQFAKLWGDKDGLAYAVTGGGDAVLTVLNRAAGRTVTVPVSGVAGLSDGPLTDVLTGKSFTVSGGSLSVELPEDGAVVLAK